MLTLEQILTAAFCGVLGFVFVNILSDIGMIFGWFRNLLESERADRIIPAWLYKIFTCSFCFAGQAALWLYLGLYWSQYDPLHHIAFIIISIFTVQVIMTRFADF